MPSTNLPTTPQHSRAAAVAPSSNIPTTPKSSGRHHQQQHQMQQRRQRKAQSMSPQSQMSFATSSLCSSPSARNVPMPPMEWLDKLSVPSCSSSASLSRPSSSISNGSSASSASSSPSPSFASPSPLDMLFSSGAPKGAGVRVCPMQLIAAVASA